MPGSRAFNVVERTFMRTRLAIRRAVAIGIALTLVVCVPAAAQSTRTGAQSFLWKIQNGAGVLYLAGSVHALSADIYPLNAAFQRAFDASGALVEEIDLGGGGQITSSLMLLGKGVFQDGRTFDQVVSKETAALVTARLKDTVPPEVLKPMKPWMVDLMLAATELQKEGLDPNLGLDKYFFDKAQAAGKPVIGLETAESQIDRLDQMPPALQEQMLRSTLEDLDTQRNSLKSIVDAWRRGDARTLETTLLAGFTDYPAAYTSLIVERNRNWMPQLESCLSRSSPCFVVVGAAHLIGPDGLLTMLQRKGYRVEQQ
jgi:uncharacterized protein YbaP (TraB family)